MKKLVITLFICISSIAYSQIASGTIDPSPYAQLDLVSDNKGVLIPRLELIDRHNPNPIDDNVDNVPKSLLVFHKADNPDTPLGSGYYYWLFNQWNRLVTENDVEILAQRPWNKAGEDTPATAYTQDIYQMGHVGIGTKTPTGALTIVNEGIDDSRDDIVIKTYKNGTNHTPGLFFQIADGTATSPKLLLGNQILGAIRYRGYVDNKFQDLSSIVANYKGGGLGHSSNLEFYTSAADTPQMTLTETGALGIGIDNSTPHASAIVAINATNKGFLPPRVALKGTTDLTTIPAPATGLLVYNTVAAPGGGANGSAVKANKLYTWSGSLWDVFIDQDEMNLSVSEALITLGVPRSVIFELTTTISNFLETQNPQVVPMTSLANGIPEYISYNATTSTVTFEPGVYTISFVYEASHNTTGCTIASYTLDVPKNATDGVKTITTTASHRGGVLSNHGGTISYTATLNETVNWPIRLSRGASGNCTGAGMSLVGRSTQLSILRIGDAL